MNPYSGLCDDFYVNMNLCTEMELPSNRETILHFFERIRKAYPEMRNFYCREEDEFVLEEDKEEGRYRWCSVELRRVCSGYVNPEELEKAFAQHRLVLQLAPYELSISPLDCEALDVLFGFDFTYRGNHNQAVAEALGVPLAFERFAEWPGATVIHYEPCLTLALDRECRRQCRVSLETRTNAYHVRTGDYPEEQLSVYVTCRQYGSLPNEDALITTFHELAQLCQQVIDTYVIDSVLQPLARVIATQ
jgi:hypothetical protein